MSKFLMTNRHGTVYYFRRRVPDDLLAKIGRRYIVKSLKTCVRRDAIVYARIAASKLDVIFAELRRMPHFFDPNLITGGFITLNIDLNEQGKPKSIAASSEEHEVPALERLIGSTLDKLNRGQVECEETGNELSGVSVTINPALSAGPSPLQKASPAASSSVKKSLKDALEEYKNKAQKSAGSMKTYLSRLRPALKYFGEERDLFSIEQGDLADYAENHVRNLDISINTQGFYIENFCSLINWHRTRKTGMPLLTSRSLVPEDKTPNFTKRRAFTLNELEVLFKNVSQYKEECPQKYWVTIAVPFLGCRVEELAQVNLHSDFIRDEETGVYYLKLMGGEDSDGVVRKSMKNKSSWRHVPIHSALVEHGFVDYLLGERKSFSRPFERCWKAYCDESETGLLKWSHYITNWGGRELKKLFDNKSIIKNPGNNSVEGPPTYFHSMRHLFRSVLDVKELNSACVAALCGHGYDGISEEAYRKLVINHNRFSKECIEPGLEDLVVVLKSLQAYEKQHDL